MARWKRASGYVFRLTTIRMSDSGVHRIRTVARTELECVAGGRSNYHDKCHGPLQEVRAERRPERFGRHPEVGVGKDTLSTPYVSPSVVDGISSKTTYLPISRIIRDDPISTASKFPKALSKTKTLSAVSAPRLRNTVVKNTEAAISPEDENSSFGTIISMLVKPSVKGGPELCQGLTRSEVRNIAKHVENRDN